MIPSNCSRAAARQCRVHLREASASRVPMPTAKRECRALATPGPRSRVFRDRAPRPNRIKAQNGLDLLSVLAARDQQRARAENLRCEERGHLLYRRGPAGLECCGYQGGPFGRARRRRVDRPKGESARRGSVRAARASSREEPGSMRRARDRAHAAAPQPQMIPRGRSRRLRAEASRSNPSAGVRRVRAHAGFPDSIGSLVPSTKGADVSARARRVSRGAG